MSFLKNVIKETGNEFGTIAADGLSTADISGMWILAAIFLMPYAAVVFTVGYLRTKLQRLQESRQQARRSLF